MTQYSVQHRDGIFVKGTGFLSFTKIMGKKIDKYTIKDLNSKYSQNPLDHAKQSPTDVLKTTSQKAIQKTAEVTGNLIGNRIANKITKVSKHSSQNTLERLESETERKIFISRKNTENY